MPAVAVPVDVHFYFKHRIEPIWVRGLFPVPQQVGDVTTLMEFAHQYLLAQIDTQGMIRIILESDVHSVKIVFIDELQFIDVIAPDTLPKGLGKIEEEEEEEVDGYD